MNIKKLEIPTGTLALKRSRTVWMDELYYEEKTEIWVFGDEHGYCNLARVLRSVCSRNQTVDISNGIRSNGMSLLLIPASEPVARARIKMFERIVFKKTKPQMELVIYGNAKGFCRLAEIFDRLVVTSLDDPVNHEHVNDWFDRWVVKKSVSLNIRGPVRKWSRKSLGDYYETARKPGEYYLPSNIEYLDRESLPYVVPVPGKSHHLSLRDSNRP